jgi:hypothetical protein
MWESSVVTFDPSVTKVCIQMCMIFFFFIKDDLLNQLIYFCLMPLSAIFQLYHGDQC